nr:DUF4810 domain-containing protein [Neptunicella marina]
MCACKTTEPLYYYGEYNQAVYSYFKSDELSQQEQIAALNQVIQKAASKGKAVPPGVHAQLGMLYFENGNQTLGEQHFMEEKQRFPESAQYIDFLLNAAKKGGQNETN